MIKLINTKFSRSLFLLISFALFCCLSGCGSGGPDAEDKAADAAETGTGTGTGTTMMLTATPDKLYAGTSSILVAKVSDATGGPVSGISVTFAVKINNSDPGGTPLSVVRAITDASGVAIATYTVGNASPNLEIEDTVTATTSGSSGVVNIKRLPTVGTGIRISSFTEDPETSGGSAIGPPWEDVIMKVTVTTDNLKTPVVGETVTFTIVEGKGTLTNPTMEETSLTVTDETDDNGEAWILFTRPDKGTGDTVIRAQVQETTNGGDAARIVYWTDDCYVHTCCVASGN